MRSAFEHGHERNDAALKKKDLFDLLTGSMQRVARKENHLAKVRGKQG
jgi:hypothetical protein